MDITTAAQDVLELLSREGIVLSLDVGEAETLLRAKMLEVARAALQHHMDRQALGYAGSSRACGCGGSQRFVGHREKVLATLVGPVRLRRAYYHCGACGASCFPYDQQAGLEACKVSPGLAKAAALAGIEVPFAQASKLLAELSGIDLSESTIARVTQQAGQQADQIEQQQAATIRQQNHPPEAPVAGRLYNSADGAMIHTLEKWQEVKTHVCYWKDAQGQQHTRYRSRLETVESFVGHAWALAARWGLENCRQSVLIGDGAAWIWERLGPIFDESIQIVDWFHAAEHLWACGRALYPDVKGTTSQACKDWIEPHKELLWNGQVKELLAALAIARKRLRGKAKRAALEGLMTYLTNQQSRLDYQRFRDQGLQIGSGTVESACRHVVQARLKRAGTRWKPVHAQAVLSLRTCRLNGEWEAFWNSRSKAA
jgi:hypothetical protein